MRKSVGIWVLTTLTFISLIHFVEAITAVILNNPIRLLQIYPFINGLLTSMSAETYFIISAASTIILWGITCLVAFHNPVEVYLNKYKAAETQFQEKGEILNLMYETVESDHETLTQLKDMMHNVRAEVKEIQSAKQPKPQAAKEKRVPISKSTNSKAPISQHSAITKQKKTALQPIKQKTAKKNTANQRIKIKTRGIPLPAGKNNSPLS